VDGKVLETIPEDSGVLEFKKINLSPAIKDTNGWVNISQSGSNLLVSNKSQDLLKSATGDSKKHNREYFNN
jgi:hypothetical protein